MESSPESVENEPLVCEKIGEPMPDIAGIGVSQAPSRVCLLVADDYW